jgi:hypothetical protein
VEASAIELARVTRIATAAGMTIALAAPDSLIAVAPAIDVTSLLAEMGDLHEGRVALGRSRATISGDVVDGPALDVESWAPYPLMNGLWVADDLS